MFVPFFETLRRAGVPVSLREYLAFLAGLRVGLATYDTEAFYYLARTAMVKDERHIDRFDQVFAHVFRGLEAVSGEQGIDPMALLQSEAVRAAARARTSRSPAPPRQEGGAR